MLWFSGWPAFRISRMFWLIVFCELPFLSGTFSLLSASHRRLLFFLRSELQLHAAPAKPEHPADAHREADQQTEQECGRRREHLDGSHGIDHLLHGRLRTWGWHRLPHISRAFPETSRSLFGRIGYGHAEPLYGLDYRFQYVVEVFLVILYFLLPRLLHRHDLLQGLLL